MGKGVLKAVESINKTTTCALVSKKLNVMEQEKINKLKMERGWRTNPNLGAMPSQGVPHCVQGSCPGEGGVLNHHTTELASNTKAILPVLAFNVINCSSHTGNKLAMQEFKILPVGVVSFKEAVCLGAKVYKPDKCHQGEVQQGGHQHE